MMTYDGLVLAAVISELKRTIAGGPIQGIRQHNDTDFTFEVRSRGRTNLLFASVHARFARLHTTASNLPVPQTPHGFCMLLRKYLKGSRITSIEQVGFDRVAIIKTEAPDGNRNALILELMGKHSNLILTSDSGRILGAAKNITAAVSRYRQILPGRDYLSPPGGAKANPLESSQQIIASLWREGLSEDASVEDVTRWLVAAFNGIGPFLAQELVQRAGSSSLSAVESALGVLRAIVAEQDYAPVLIVDDRGKSAYAYPIPVGQYPIANQHERQSMNEVLDTLFRDLIRCSDFDTEYTALENGIKRAIAWRKQILRDTEKAIAERDKSERYKQYGELLMAAGNSVSKGQSVARLVDYYDPNMGEIEIPLDEKQSAKENAERYFKRYRKALDGAAAAEERQRETEKEIVLLQNAQNDLSRAVASEDFKALRMTLTERGLLRAERKPAEQRRKEEPEFAGARIRRVISEDGYEILYGENSTSNDYLTTKVARSNDMWFHARSVTGAHVVVRTANKPDAVPLATVRQAAEIAAKNSDAKHSRLVAVDYTLKKHVRKPRASAPGFVVYSREKTVDITPGIK